MGGPDRPGRSGAGSGSDDAQRFSDWVQQAFTARTVDGATLYVLTPGRAGKG